MGTLKEFVERLQSDEEFAAKVNAAAVAKQEAGSDDPKKNFVSIVEEFGYSITEEELESLSAQNKSNLAELSEEEMGKVAGGTEAVLWISATLASMYIISKIVDR